MTNRTWDLSGFLFFLCVCVSILSSFPTRSTARRPVTYFVILYLYSFCCTSSCPSKVVTVSAKPVRVTAERVSSWQQLICLHSGDPLNNSAKVRRVFVSSSPFARGASATTYTGVQRCDRIHTTSVNALVTTSVEKASVPHAWIPGPSVNLIQ